MARLARLASAGHLHHVIQRGHNRMRIFCDDEDRRLCKAILLDAVRASQVSVHAYALMENHLHLLATPRDDVGLSRLMQALGRRYVMAFNRRHGFSGSLWEGRFRATVIEPDSHLLQAMVYVESHAARTGGAVNMNDDRWSSRPHHLGETTDAIITDHPSFWRLGNTPFEREMAYRNELDQGTDEAFNRALTEATLRGWALGSPSFLEALATRTGRRVTPKAAGRPPKKKVASSVE